ncbi:MAG TPA: tRNA adenosine(34) deaminase TadA [Kofleriaceae bacterium]|nr:tRNA adenosine(34) deaminase TadA [Kofleriaceae bacterium]
MTDEHWMSIALEEARAAAAAGDVPVGAVIVIGDQIVGRGRNRREVDRDPTAHAEIVALREAAQGLKQWRVEGMLFVTQEPCPMCAGALVNARVARLVFGCPNPKAGAVASLYQIASDPRLNHRLSVTGGVRADECAAVLQQFFAELRRGPTYQ